MRWLSKILHIGRLSSFPSLPVEVSASDILLLKAEARKAVESWFAERTGGPDGSKGRRSDRRERRS